LDVFILSRIISDRIINAKTKHMNQKNIKEVRNVETEAKIINRDYGRFKRFCRHGERIDLSQELELSDYVGSELLEVTTRYNMLRSKLEIDWLVDGKTVSHSSLPITSSDGNSPGLPSPIKLKRKL